MNGNLSVFSPPPALCYLCTMETKIFDIKLPTSWAELSDKQLMLVFELLARDLSAAEVKTFCLMFVFGLGLVSSINWNLHSILPLSS